MPRATAVKTYGYTRRGLVPDITDTHPKLCPKSNDWFAAKPRARVCDGCLPKSVLAKRSDQDKHHVNESRHIITRRRKITRNIPRSELRKMALDAAHEDQLTGKSYGCSHPKDQQADHLPSARRHPFAGARPDESGWCDVACNCPCHVSAYNAIERV